MQIDYFHPPGDSAPVDAALRAQQAGFDGFWMAETKHDPFLPLAVLADRGLGLELGTSIAVAFARSPMTTAHTAWDLAAASGGRFTLGLGTQVRAHVVGRFSMPWSSPVSRMRDFVGALRAIWLSWQEGSPLRHRSDHYRLTVMTPFFDPGPIDHPAIPIHLAAVGTGMARLAGEALKGDGTAVRPGQSDGRWSRLCQQLVGGMKRRIGCQCSARLVILDRINLKRRPGGRFLVRIVRGRVAGRGFVHLGRLRPLRLG